MAAAPVRVPLPDLDPVELGKEFRKLIVRQGCKRAFSLYSYNFLTKPRAVCARSLHNMFPLVRSGEIHHHFHP